MYEENDCDRKLMESKETLDKKWQYFKVKQTFTVRLVTLFLWFLKYRQIDKTNTAAK